MPALYLLKNAEGAVIGRSEEPITVDGRTAKTKRWRWPSIPAGCTVEEVADFTLEKAALAVAIKAKREKVQDGGVLVGGKWFHTDSRSRIQQLGLLAFGESVPAVRWKTMDGSFVTITPPLVLQLFAAVAAREQAVFAYAEGLLLAAAEASDPDEIDIQHGWPASYGD